MSRIQTKFIASNAVTNAVLAQAPAYTLKGNNTGSIANVSDLTVSQIITLLSLIASNVSYTPGVTANWTVVPTTVQQALDRIAEQLGIL